MAGGGKVSDLYRRDFSQVIKKRSYQKDTVDINQQSVGSVSEDYLQGQNSQSFHNHDDPILSYDDPTIQSQVHTHLVGSDNVDKRFDFQRSAIQIFSHTFDIEPFAADISFATNSFTGNSLLDSLLYGVSNGHPNLTKMYFGPELGVFDFSLPEEDCAMELDKFSAILESWLSSSLNDCSTRGSADLARRRMQVYKFIQFVISNLIAENIKSDLLRTKLSVFAEKLVTQILDLWGLYQVQEHISQTTFANLSLNLFLFSLMLQHTLSKRDEDGHLKLLGWADHLVKMLLYCLDDIRDCMHRHRSSMNRRIGTESYILEVVFNTIHFLDGVAVLRNCSALSFFSVLFRVLKNNSSNEILLLHEYKWYAIFVFSAFYQLRRLLSAGHPTIHNWELIESMWLTMAAELTNRDATANIISYFKVFLSRCLVLINVWEWQANRSIVLSLYHYYSDNQFRNPERTFGYRFPSFLDSWESVGSPSPNDTIFHLFLKFLALTIRAYSSKDSLNELLKLTGQVTPLNSRSYNMSSELDIAELQSLSNEFAIYLTMYVYCPEECKPQLAQLKDRVEIQHSHILA